MRETLERRLAALQQQREAVIQRIAASDDWQLKTALDGAITVVAEVLKEAATPAPPAPAPDEERE